MESEEITTGRVHQGRNIRRTRMEKGIKQEVLSELVHMTQSNVSKYENTRVVDDEILCRFAKALNVSFDYLKNAEEDAQTVVFENITNNDHAGANSNIGYATEENDNRVDNRVTTFNPIDKIVELYDKLLKEKDDKFAMLEKRLENLENSLNK